jgi:hypothetical protein
VAAAIGLVSGAAGAIEQAVSVLVDSLGEEDRYLAEDVAQTLIRIGPGIVPALLPVVVQQTGEPAARRRRLRALRVLRRTRAPAAVAALRALVSDPDPRVRLGAVSALAEFQDTAGITEGLRGFMGDREAAVRVRALSALQAREALNPELAVPLLGDADRAVRAIARTALREQGPAARPALKLAVRGLGAPCRGLRARAFAWWTALRLLRGARRLARSTRT